MEKSVANHTAPLKVRPAGIDQICEFDLQLRDHLKLANASPFLGQYDLPGFIESGIDLRLCEVSPVNALLSLFRVAPAAAVCFVARIASAKAGSESFGEFYPHLEERLDHVLSNAERNEVGKAFRDACLRLFLPVPSGRENAASWKWRREYLMQAGVIRSQLPALAEAALEMEDRLQLPDDFDPEEIRSWQAELGEYFEYGHKLLKQILTLDADGWHSSAIARIRRGEAPITQFEQALARALEAAHQRPRLSHSLVGKLRPEIRLEGGQVILRTPNHFGINWEIDGGWTDTVRMAADQEVEVPVTEHIRWRSSSAGDDWFALPVWSVADMLIFDGISGRLLSRAKKGECRDVDASEPVLVTKEPIGIGIFQCQSTDGQVWLTPLNLAGQLIKIPGWIELRARPMLRWLSLPVLSLEGKAVFGAAGAFLGYELSEEQQKAWGRNFELLVRLRGGGSAKFPFDFKDPVRPQAILDSKKLDVGIFGLVTAALVQSGTDRPLLNAPAAWFWPNLIQFDGARFQGSPPDNLDIKQSRGIQPDKDGISLTLRPDRLAQVAFHTADRVIVLRLPRPGMALELEEQGHWRPIDPGQRMTDDGRPRRLRIWSGDHQAALQVGTQVVQRAFGTSGHRTISLNGLATSNTVNIRYWRSGNEADAIDIISVVRAATPTAIELLRQGGGPLLRVELPDNIVNFEFAGMDLLTGAACALKGAANGVVSIKDRGSWIVRPSFGALSAGVWLLELHAQEGGEEFSRPVRTSRGDRLAILVPAEGRYLAGRLGDIPVKDAAAKRIYFIQLSRALMRLWSKEVWEQQGGLQQMAEIWTKIGKDLAQSFGADDHAALLLAASQAVPFDSPPSWVPLLHPIDLAPQLFSGPLEVVSNVLKESEDEGSRGLVESLSGDPRERFRHQQALLRFSSRLAAAGSGGGSMNLIRRGRLTALADKAARNVRARNFFANAKPLLELGDTEEELLHNAPYLATYLAQQTRLAMNPGIGLVSSLIEEPQGEPGMFIRLAPELFGLHLSLWSDLKA